MAGLRLRYNQFYSPPGVGGGGSFFPYILSSEIQAMFSQLLKIITVEGGTASHYNILVIHKFIDFMWLSRHSLYFVFSFKQIFCVEFITSCNI